jgi:DNA-binding transcriptional regulator YiaG
MNCYHLIAAGDRWALTRDEDSTALREFTTRWQAIDECRRMLDGEACSLIIHRPDGSVEAMRTYSEYDDLEHAEDENSRLAPVRVLNAIRSRASQPISRRRHANGGTEPRSVPTARLKSRRFVSAADRAEQARRIGALILSRRQQQGLSRGGLASILGVSAWSIKEWEKGHSCPDKFRRQVTEWLGSESEVFFSPAGEGGHSA